jgi:hypothetical protein
MAHGMDGQMEGRWMETVVACFKALHFIGLERQKDIMKILLKTRSRDSSVGIATGCGLDV